jgi:hypothetical protein
MGNSWITETLATSIYRRIILVLSCVSLLASVIYSNANSVPETLSLCAAVFLVVSNLLTMNNLQEMLKHLKNLDDSKIYFSSDIKESVKSQVLKFNLVSILMIAYAILMNVQMLPIPDAFPLKEFKTIVAFIMIVTCALVIVTDPIAILSEIKEKQDEQKSICHTHHHH